MCLPLPPLSWALLVPVSSHWGWAGLDGKNIGVASCQKAAHVGSPARVLPEWHQAPGWRENGRPLAELVTVLTTLPEWL